MEIKRYLSPLLKWWWLILISAALAGVSGYLAMRNEPDVYQAKATLMTGRPFDSLNPEGSQLYLSQQLASGYAQIAQRGPVRSATQEALGLDFLPEYSVAVPAQTNLLEITVTDTSPVRAQAVANELARQLILLSPGQDIDNQGREAFINKQLSDLELQIEETQDEIALLQGQLGDMFSAREIADSQTEISALQTKLTTLQSNYTSFLTNSQQQATNVLSVVESASLPERPIGPNRTLSILLSVALGTALAVGAAYVLEYIDDSIKSEDDIRYAVGLPVLAALEKNGDTDDYPALTMKAPRSPNSESFRELRTRILFLSSKRSNGSFLVTSASPGEGKSFTAANLAIVIAQAGYRTMLVDADLRRPKQHEIFQLNNKLGLSNLILEANTSFRPDSSSERQPLGDLLESLIQDTQQGGLRVLTAGTIPPNPAELIGSNGMGAAMEALRKKFDYIVMDSSPGLVVTDALLLGSLADSVIVVSAAKQTRGKNLKNFVTKLREVDANIIGVVLNLVPKITAGGYTYYSSYIEANGEFESGNGETTTVPDKIRRKFLRLSNGNGSNHGEVHSEQP